MTARIRLRRGTRQEWESANPTLARGEVAYEIESLRFKIGDGSTAWTALPYQSSTYNYTYNSSGPQGGNHYNNWADLVTALSIGTTVDQHIYFEQDETLPAGDWNLNRVHLHGNGIAVAANLPGALTLTLADGFKLTGETTTFSIEDGLGIRSVSTEPVFNQTVLGTTVGATWTVGTKLTCTQCEFFRLNIGGTILNGGIFENDGYEVLASVDPAAFTVILMTGNNATVRANSVRGSAGLVINYISAPSSESGMPFNQDNFAGTFYPVIGSRAEYIGYDNTTVGAKLADLESRIAALEGP